MYVRYSDESARKVALTAGDFIAFSLPGEPEIQTGRVAKRNGNSLSVIVSGDGVKTKGKTYDLGEISLYRDSEVEDPDIKAPIHSIEWTLDEKNGELNVYATPRAAEEPLLVAQMALGSGHFIWASRAFYEFYGTDEGEVVVDKMVQVCQAHPAKLNAQMIEMLHRLSELNFLRQKLVKELTEALDARYDLSMDINGLSPLDNFSLNQLVQGEVVEREGGKGLHCQGHRIARSNGADGIYCWQTVGYCEDDYYGEQFVRVEGNTYLCLPFEF